MSGGGNVLLHIVADRLETFASHKRGSQLLPRGEGTYGLRVIKAFKEVMERCNWEGKYLFVVSPSSMIEVNITALGLDRTRSVLVRVKDNEEGREWIGNAADWMCKMKA